MYYAGIKPCSQCGTKTGCFAIEQGPTCLDCLPYARDEGEGEVEPYDYRTYNMRFTINREVVQAPETFQRGDADEPSPDEHYLPSSGQEAFDELVTREFRGGDEVLELVDSGDD